MRHLISWSALGAVVLFGAGPDTQTPERPEPPPLPAQTNAPAAATASPQIGLVDMSRLFKSSSMYLARRAALKEDVRKADQRMRKMVAGVKELEQELKKVIPGTSDYADLSRQLASRKAEVTAFRDVQKKEFLRQESQLYRDVYLVAQREIEHFAKAEGLKLVLRYTDGPLPAHDPEQIIKGLNRTVIYQDGVDITDQIIQRLNSREVSRESVEDRSL